MTFLDRARMTFLDRRANDTLGPRAKLSRHRSMLSRHLYRTAAVDLSIIDSLLCSCETSIPNPCHPCDSGEYYNLFLALGRLALAVTPGFRSIPKPQIAFPPTRSRFFEPNLDILEHALRHNHEIASRAERFIAPLLGNASSLAAICWASVEALSLDWPSICGYARLADLDQRNDASPMRPRFGLSYDPLEDLLVCQRDISQELRTIVARDLQVEVRFDRASRGR